MSGQPQRCTENRDSAVCKIVSKTNHGIRAVLVRLTLDNAKSGRWYLADRISWLLGPPQLASQQPHGWHLFSSCLCYLLCTVGTACSRSCPSLRWTECNRYRRAGLRREMRRSRATTLSVPAAHGGRAPIDSDLHQTIQTPRCLYSACGELSRRRGGSLRWMRVVVDIAVFGSLARNELPLLCFGLLAT